MTSLEHCYVSSSLVKEIAQFGGDVSSMLPRRGAPTRLREALAPRVAPRAACHNRRDAPPGRRAQGGRPLDIIFLVERLESLIANGKPLPADANAIIDRDAALNLIDELRVAVPEEVRAAKRINSEGERIIEKAQEEAERIVARAQEQAAFLIEERGLTEAADAESRRIIAIAEDESAEVRRGADEYAAGVLAGLEADVTRTLSSIERGHRDARRATCGERARAGDGDDRPRRGLWRPRRGRGRGRGSLARRTAMTTRDPHATHPVDTAGDPLTFAMSGLMAEPAGRCSSTTSRPSTWSSTRSSRRQSPSRAGCASPGRTGA